LCIKNKKIPEKIIPEPISCCGVTTSPKIKYASMHVPIGSPKILIEIVEVFIHLINQLKMVCPNIVEINAKPKKHIQSDAGYPVRGYPRASEYISKNKALVE
jgi:hypothetical protein